MTLFGSGFGVTPGRVIFTDSKDAQAPAACGAASSWTSGQAIVGVPGEASDGSIKLCTAGASPLCDATNDARGPIVPVQKAGSGIPNGFFDVNEVSRPGLCLAYSPTPNTTCAPGDTGDKSCRQDNKDPQGNPDPSAFCHPEEVCVFPKGLVCSFTWKCNLASPRNHCFFRSVVQRQIMGRHLRGNRIAAAYVWGTRYRRSRRGAVKILPALLCQRRGKANFAVIMPRNLAAQIRIVPVLHPMP